MGYGKGVGGIDTGRYTIALPPTKFAEEISHVGVYLSGVSTEGGGEVSPGE